MLHPQLPKPFNKITIAQTQQTLIKAGDSLFLQGGITKGLYYLMAGAIDLTRQTSSGHCIIIHRANAGEMFAEASLFTNEYHCSAIATRDSQVIECRRDIVKSLMETDLDFTRSVAAQFATQIQESRRRIELLSIRSADERILSAINSGLLVDDISKLADLLGLAQETVYRSLKRLADNQQITKNARGKYCPTILNG